MWQSLYVASGQTGDVSALLNSFLDSLTRQGYERYDPFAGGSGTPMRMKEFLKLIVAPAAEGWLRIMAEPGSPTAPLAQSAADLSKDNLVLHLSLIEAPSAPLAVYHGGQLAPDRLIELLRPGKTTADLARALRGSMPTLVEPTSAGALPDDIQRLAESGQVNTQQAGKMIERLTGQLFGRLDQSTGGEASALQDQARLLAMGGSNRVDWNTPAGQILRAVASVISLPATWRDPDFPIVRDAYQAARMLKKNPRASLMPDEQAALKAMPDAIQYEAVYVGR